MLNQRSMTFLFLAAYKTMTDDAIQAYADAHSEPEPPLLHALWRETHLQLLMPRMATGHWQGRLLSMFSHLLKPIRVLEIGTFTGYATLCLERVSLHVGDARDVLLTLVGEVWDLVFIDADKINNGRYFELVVRQVRPGGLLIVDNVLWGGKALLDYPLKANDHDTKAVRAFNEQVRTDSRVVPLLLPVRDGLLLLRRV